MDIKAYIESGIIESYVLGLADQEDIAILEGYAVEYPEVRRAIDEFAALLERQAIKNAIIPPAINKEKIRARLAPEFVEALGEKDVKEESARTLRTGRLGGHSYFSRVFPAAAAVLLMISLAISFYYFQKAKGLEEKYEALLSEKESLIARAGLLNNSVFALKQSVKVMNSSGVKAVQLKGVSGKDNHLAVVYWDVKSKDVYLMPTNLDELRSENQYQLWAIVDGKPVDAGVISDCGGGLCKLKNIPRAQAFAITIEKKGGSASPTLTAMVVMGEV